ncbi:glycine dehydrogenase (decarboxylating) beta subunit [Anaerobranca californiensis DSM 14826]|uniref:Probable glycine dehydrogenase (decarboxylating) subunit 2 n=1 Tax=Anaerobranca californiensis DSM 14826 TaxID=1120989 RepID=A0A1M6L8V4_9FIRM|nr:aminomethyl-transferring glycine dehydrogenase subunit GcvPB [Anaerobranca californiensis]SHJ67620.1 glycine dehydrogenase (decarboxylating) beta subunit [Anaerobranca californiensis DSM 14826]
MRGEVKTIFEKSIPGHVGFSLPDSDVGERQLQDLLPAEFLRKEPLELPEVSEGEVVRHYVELSTRNHGVDSGFYPLGSCTMKYNPKINEDMARISGFAQLHPLMDEDGVQGALELMYNLQNHLGEITGMDAVTLQPVAGAHGELVGLMLIDAYHKNRGERRKTVLVPDSAHGTNPASAAMAGFKVVEIKSDCNGSVCLDSLKEALNDDVAALMLTNPSTLGLFEENIVEIAKLVHEAGGLLYYDGANANAIMGIARPGDMGFDVVHLNLHKTFSTPHGGGGPGSGPVGVKKELAEFLPTPIIEKNGGKFTLNYNLPKSIGRVHSFYGNFGVNIRAYSYILTMGAKGLRQVSIDAVLNANYLMEHLKGYYHLPYDKTCMHEFVLSGKNLKEYGVRTLDVAKALLDYGIHPPTIYFPLIVEEALMIEPTETETKETLDRFITAMKEIAQKAKENPEEIKNAPHKTFIKRLDEVGAARNPVVCCTLNLNRQ